MTAHPPQPLSYYRHDEKGALTEPALAELRQDLRDFERASAELYNQSCDLFLWLMTLLSAAAKTAIRNDAAWAVVSISFNPLLLFQLIIKVMCCPNAAEIQQRTIAFLNIKQTGEFDTYIEDFQTGLQRLITDLGDEDVKIKCDSVGALVLLGGLDRSQFQYKIDSLLDAAPTLNLRSNVADLTQKLGVYAKVHPKPEPESSALFSGKGAAVRPAKYHPQPPPRDTSPRQIPCHQCNRPFTPRISRHTGQPFTTCYSCYGASKLPPTDTKSAAPTDITSAHVAQGLVAAAELHSNRISMEADYQSQQIARFQLQRQQLLAASAYSELDDEIFANHAFLAAPVFSQPLPTAAAPSDLDADCQSEYSSPDEHSAYGCYNSDEEPYEFSPNELAYLQSPECLDGSDFDPTCDYSDFVFPSDAEGLLSPQQQP